MASASATVMASVLSMAVATYLATAQAPAKAMAMATATATASATAATVTALAVATNLATALAHFNPARGHSPVPSNHKVSQMPATTTAHKLKTFTNWNKSNSHILSAILSTISDPEKIPLTFLRQHTPLHLLTIKDISFWDYKKEWRMFEVFKERQNLKYRPESWTNTYYLQILESYTHGTASYDELMKAFSQTLRGSMSDSDASSIKQWFNHPKIIASTLPSVRAARQAADIIITLKNKDQQDADDYWYSLFS